MIFVCVNLIAVDATAAHVCRINFQRKKSQGSAEKNGSKNNNNAPPLSLAYFLGVYFFDWYGTLQSDCFVLSTMWKIPGVIKFYCRTGSICPNQQIIFDRQQCVCVCEATFLCVLFIPSGNRQCDSNSSIFKRADLLFLYQREDENFEARFVPI